MALNENNKIVKISKEIINMWNKFTQNIKSFIAKIGENNLLNIFFIFIIFLLIAINISGCSLKDGREYELRKSPCGCFDNPYYEYSNINKKG